MSVSSPDSAGRISNFSAGPSALPLSALQQAQHELLNYQQTGMGVMEMSHRSKPFENIIQQAEKDLRELLNIPSTYSVLFTTGGASTQFSAVPLNFSSPASQGPAAEYLVTGAWSLAAAKEAIKYTQVHYVLPPTQTYDVIPPVSQWSLLPSSSYLHVCHNETVHGVEFPCDFSFPSTKRVIADMSSNFLSRPFDVEKYDMIYAGAQKNIGPAGVTVVIVRNSFLRDAQLICPTMLNYRFQIDKQSLYNTPPCFNIYMVGLVLKWMKQQGGLSAIAAQNADKSSLLYDAIDNSCGYYRAFVQKEARSRMNVVFTVTNKDGSTNNALNNTFVKEAEAAGLSGLAGHRSVGGLRASLYNAVSLDDTRKLVEFMRAFQQKHPLL